MEQGRIETAEKDMEAHIDEFEEKLGYRFKDKELLKLALTHRSFVREEGSGKTGSNERLEFLGDALFDAIVGEAMYRRMEDEKEGALTKCRSHVVCEASLADRGRETGIGAAIRMGKGEEAAGGRDKTSIIADALEAVIGAMYLDGGFDVTRETVLRLFDRRIEMAIGGELFTDYKSRLQELAQKYGVADIKYETVKESGPPHDKTFFVQVKVNGKTAGRGKGKSKKEAEQEAAKESDIGEEGHVF